MSLIVSLSTIHDYSIDKTVKAFVQLCDQFSQGCLKSMPGFFQSLTNQAWVMAKYQLNYSSLIEPYKLGKITTEEFLDNLSKIFDFMNDLNKELRHALLTDAWNASIRLGEATKDRLSLLVEQAKTEPVYLISNTNELNIKAILTLLQESYPNLEFNEAIDISIKNSKEPIEILPNIYLCLSYRYGAFKEKTLTTASLLEDVAKTCPKPVTLVSQYSSNIVKAKELHLDNVLRAEEFYDVSQSNSLTY